MRKRKHKQNINNKMADLSPEKSAITLNINNLNVPLKDKLI